MHYILAQGKKNMNLRILSIPKVGLFEIFKINTTNLFSLKMQGSIQRKFKFYILCEGIEVCMG